MDRFLRIADIQAELHCGKTLARRVARAAGGQIVGRSYFVSRAALERFLLAGGAGGRRSSSSASGTSIASAAGTSSFGRALVRARQNRESP